MKSTLQTPPTRPRMRETVLLLAATIATIWLTGCAPADAGADGAAQAPAPMTPAPSTQEAPASTAPSDPAPSDAEPTSACPVFGADISLRLLAESWALVVASREASDGPIYVEDFADAAEEFYDDVEDCEGSELTLAAAELQFQASLLMGEPPSDEDSEEIQATGNELLELAGVTDAQFIPASCTDMVDETDECTTLS